MFSGEDSKLYDFCLSLVDVLDLVCYCTIYYSVSARMFVFGLELCYLTIDSGFRLLNIFYLNQVLYNLGVSIIPENNRTRSIIIRTRPEFLNNPNGFYTSPPENPKT